MRSIAFAAALLAVVALSAFRPTAATDGADSTRTTAGVTRTPAAAPASPGLALPGHFLRDGYRAPSGGYLTLSLSSMQWYAPPTRLEAIAQGAGTAATVGLFLGAIGNTFGLFDENTAWILTGSMAAMGAMYGGMSYEPEPTLRFRPWNPR